MAFKMKYSNGGFPYQSPLKDHEEGHEEKDVEFTATSNQPSISEESIGFDHDEIERRKSFEDIGGYWDEESGKIKIKPTMGTAGPIDAGKKLWSLGKSLFTD